METACPDAWLIILTNPLTQLTRAALQALLMDPAIQTWFSAAPMLDEMLAATAAFLPQFR